MKLRQLLEGGIIDQAMSLPEPSVGDDYASEKVKRYLEIINKALDAMRKKDNNDANDAIVADLRDKKKKWTNIDKETTAPKIKREEPPPEDEKPPEEPPPEEEDMSPEEEEADKEAKKEEDEDEKARKEEEAEREKEAAERRAEKRKANFRKKVKESLETPFERYLKEEKTKILKVYKNKEYGIEAHVAKIHNGFSVSLKDIDAGEFLGTNYVFPNEKDAHKKAKELVK